jgi:hypothetical protein
MALALRGSSACADALDDDHPRERVVGVRSAASAAAGQCQQRERDRHQADPDPLAPAEFEAEEALGEHGEKDETSRQYRLADREWSEAECGNVQRERHRRDAPADAPPPGAKQIDRATHRVAHVDVGSGDRPLCLNRKARFVPSADSSAQTRPTATASETSLTAGPSSEHVPGARALPPTAGSARTDQDTPPCVRVVAGQRRLGRPSSSSGEGVRRAHAEALARREAAVGPSRRGPRGEADEGIGMGRRAVNPHSKPQCVQRLPQRRARSGSGARSG